MSLRNQFLAQSLHSRSTLSVLAISTLAIFWSSVSSITSDPVLAQEGDPNTALADVTPDNAANDEEDAETGPLQYVAPKSIEMLIGLKVTAGDGNMRSTLATTVFPVDWPEQQVEIVESRIPNYFRQDLRELPGGNKQLILFANAIPARSVVEATVLVRIQKSHIVGPQDTSELVVPKRLPRDVSIYLKDSPYIDATNAQVRNIVRDIDKQEPANDWARIEMMYDWVRENIAYERGELKSVNDAIRDKTGDCEEMTSTFVALCRAGRIPARCVWIPNHCYPEFYMEDAEARALGFRAKSPELAILVRCRNTCRSCKKVIVSRCQRSPNCSATWPTICRPKRLLGGPILKLSSFDNSSETLPTCEALTWKVPRIPS